MSLALPTLIETAADEVASAGRAAAGTINELVHDWTLETRNFVADHASSLPIGRSRKRHSTSLVRLLLPIAVLGVVAFVIVRRRRPNMTPHLPERQQPQDHVHETVVGDALNDKRDKRKAEGAAAS
jgi:hypothetical protein